MQPSNMSFGRDGRTATLLPIGSNLLPMIVDRQAACVLYADCGASATFGYERGEIECVVPASLLFLCVLSSILSAHANTLLCVRLCCLRPRRPGGSNLSALMAFALWAATLCQGGATYIHLLEADRSDFVESIARRRGSYGISPPRRQTPTRTAQRYIQNICVSLYGPCGAIACA